MPVAFWYLAAGTLGLVVGSFLNVVIARLPGMLRFHWEAECADATGRPLDRPAPPSLTHPRSRCPSCSAPVRARDNIPLLSYLLLRGRCRDCGAVIGLRYPVVEALGALLAMLCVWRFGPGAQAALAAIFCWMLLAAAIIDLDTQLLPDSLTLPLLWLGLLANTRDLFAPLESAVLGAAFGYLVLWLVFQTFRLLTGKEGMGYGDFKLVAALGAWLGWQQLPLVILLGSVAGALIGTLMLKRAAADRATPIPFGPFLVLAGLVAMFAGPEITNAYLNWSGLR